MNWFAERYWDLYHWLYRGKWYNGLVCLFRGHKWVRVINFHGQPVTFCGRCMKRREQ